MAKPKSSENKSISKLFEVLNILDGKQIRDLKAFAEVSSNHLNEEQKQLFKHLLEACSNRRKLVEEKFTASYLPQNQKKTWNRTKTSFLKVIERYLIAELVEKNGFWGDYLLLNYYFSNNAIKNFEPLWRKKQAKLPQLELDAAHKKLLTYFLYEFKTFEKKDERQHDEYLSLTETALDEFYILQKLRMNCEQVNRQYILSQKKEAANFFFSEQTIVQLNNPEIALYYHTYQLLNNPQQTSLYWTIAQLFESAIGQFHHKTLKEVCEYLMNYCIRQINLGHYTFVKEYQKHLQCLEQNQLLLHDNQLNIHHFNNHISLALANKEFEWVENFILQNKHKLSPHPEKDNIVALTQARLYFYKNEIDKCHELLVGFYINDNLYDIIYEKLLLKIFFQNKEYKALAHRIKHFRQKMGRNQSLTNSQKEPILTFITCLETLSKVSPPPSVETVKGKVPSLDYYWLVSIQQEKVIQEEKEEVAY